MNQYSIKYRPRFLQEVIGQPGVTTDLLARTKRRVWPRAMLMKGQFGTGKTTVAHIVAMTLQCTNPGEDGRPCGECSACKSIVDERFDRDTVMLDGGQIGQKDSVVEFTSTIKLRPMYDRNRIYIIEEADQLSTGAVNALLKVLEAPQDNVFFILLSMINNGIPPAIRSRCQTYNFKPVSVMDTMLALKAVLVKEELWESPDIPDSFRTEGLSSIASSSKGSLREAFQLLERCITGEYWTADQIQEALGVLDEVATYNILQGLLIKSKEEKLWNSIYQADPGELYHYITLILADAMVAKHTGFIKDERFASSTKQIASSANAEQLFDALSDPLLAKPYIRKADLITVFMQYYKKEAPALVRKPIARRAI